MNPRILSRLIELVNSVEELHYLDIALELGVSPSTAQRYAVMMAKRYPEYVTYSRGKLVRKQVIGLENIDPMARIEAQKRTIEMLEEKLDYVERKLIELLESRWNNLSKDELRGELWDLVEYLKRG